MTEGLWIVLVSLGLVACFVWVLWGSPQKPMAHHKTVGVYLAGALAAALRHLLHGDVDSILYALFLGAVTAAIVMIVLVVLHAIIRTISRRSAKRREEQRAKRPAAKP